VRCNQNKRKEIQSEKSQVVERDANSLSRSSFAFSVLEFLQRDLEVRDHILLLATLILCVRFGNTMAMHFLICNSMPHYFKKIALHCRVMSCCMLTASLHRHYFIFTVPGVIKLMVEGHFRIY
jgi:hypothetical protein